MAQGHAVLKLLLVAGPLLMAGAAEDTGTALQVFAAGSAEDLARPCVECGLVTGNFCDELEFQTGFKCLAEKRIPSLSWVEGQRTPFCTGCERKFGVCYFCRGVPSCTPFTRR